MSLTRIRGTTGCVLYVGDSVVGPGFHENNGKIVVIHSEQVVDIAPPHVYAPYKKSRRIDIEAAQMLKEPVEHSSVCYTECDRDWHSRVPQEKPKEPVVKTPPKIEQRSKFVLLNEQWKTLDVLPCDTMEDAVRIASVKAINDKRQGVLIAQVVAEVVPDVKIKVKKISRK